MTSCSVPYCYMFVLMPAQVLVLVLESQVLDNNTVNESQSARCGPVLIAFHSAT